MPTASSRRAAERPRGSIETRGDSLRIHPATGRIMIYVACDVVNGEARVADEEELVDLIGSDHKHLAEYVPYGFYEPIQKYLDQSLA